jgi:hypothetical protein
MTVSPEALFARAMAWVKEHGAVTEHVVPLPLGVTYSVVPVVVDDAEATPGSSDSVAAPKS